MTSPAFPPGILRDTEQTELAAGGAWSRVPNKHAYPMAKPSFAERIPALKAARDAQPTTAANVPAIETRMDR